MIRTRIAPSPTGDPHVGTAYIALFNLCFARQHNGQFILRIEDTDQVRSTVESEQQILSALNWLGLQWDEGPDIGGSYGPYRQSERSQLYRDYAQQLIDSGHAFHCFRTPAEVEAVREARKSQGLSPGFKLSNPELPADELARRLKAGDPYVIRLKVPDSGACIINDMLRGQIEIDWSMVDMQVLLKSDGLPTYHLANVVDDHLMQISHVIRGEEWINSTPKHLFLYDCFGWQPPSFCHMPLLRNPDKSKLSKRKNPTCITYYERMGYLPEALVNYLGRMGWSMPDQSERFSLEAMIQQFDLSRVSTTGPVFDQEKLDWLNGVWIRETLSEEALLSRFRSWALQDDKISATLPLVHQRIEKFTDIVPLIGFLFAGNPPLTDAALQTDLEPEQQRQLLQFLLWRFEQLGHWQRDHIETTLSRLAEQMQLKLRQLMAPVFIAIAGSKNSIDIIDAMTILGSDMTRSRLKSALEVMGNPSKKELKRWEKAFAQLEQGRGEA